MSLFGKHFSSMYTGSMIGSGTAVFAVWGYIIAHVEDGHVEVNPTHLALLLGCPEPEVVSALEFLQSPDPRSRNKQFDGRRLIKVGQFAYEVPSHPIYRKMGSADERREYQKEYKRKQRGSSLSTQNEVDNSRLSVSVSVSDSSEESVRETKAAVYNRPPNPPRDPMMCSATDVAFWFCREFDIVGEKNIQQIIDAIQLQIDKGGEAQDIAQRMIDARNKYLAGAGKKFPAVWFIASGTWAKEEQWNHEKPKPAPVKRENLSTTFRRKRELDSQLASQKPGDNSTLLDSSAKKAN